jgi:hypothetical protein
LISANSVVVRAEVAPRIAREPKTFILPAERVRSEQSMSEQRRAWVNRVAEVSRGNAEVSSREHR